MRRAPSNTTLKTLTFATIVAGGHCAGRMHQHPDAHPHHDHHRRGSAVSFRVRIGNADSRRPRQHR